MRTIHFQQLILRKFPLLYKTTSFYLFTSTVSVLKYVYYQRSLYYEQQHQQQKKQKQKQSNDFIEIV